MATSSECRSESSYSPRSRSIAFPLLDFPLGGQRLDINRDLIVEKRQTRQPMHDARVSPTGPALERVDRMVETVEIKSDFRETHPIRIPAVLLK